MTAYGEMDTALAGLPFGNINALKDIESFIAAETIEFGRPVFTYDGEDENSGKCYSFYNDSATIVYDADFAATHTATITVNGVSTAAVPFNTDHDTTMDDIVAAIIGLTVPNTTVEATLDSADANNRTIHIRTKGVANTTTEVTGGTTPPDGTVTSTTGQIYIGISRQVHYDTANYVSGDSVSVMAKGKIWVDNTTAAVSNNAAYIDDSTGQFKNTAGLDVGALYRKDLAAAGIALVETFGQTRLGVADKF